MTLTCERTERDGHGIWILKGRFEGDLEASLTAIVKAETDPNVLRLDCAEVESVNSAGARAWMEVIEATAETRTIEIYRCSGSVIDLINLYPRLGRNVEILTFYYSYWCAHCRKGENVLYETRAVKSDAPPPLPTCATCGTAMAVEVPWKEYVGFLEI